MSIYPTERDYLAEEENERRLEAKLERIEDARIEKKLNEDKCTCCPECGNTEYIYKDWISKGYRVCTKCDQEWWTDIKYNSQYCK